MVICGAFGISTWCTRTVFSGFANIEEKEFALSALHAVFHFTRYGGNVMPIEGGRKLRLHLGKNQVTLYRLGNTLLLGHKGTANPIAEGCTEANFTLSGNFICSKLVFGRNTYVLQVVPGYLTR